MELLGTVALLISALVIAWVLGGVSKSFRKKHLDSVPSSSPVAIEASSPSDLAKVKATVGRVSTWLGLTAVGISLYFKISTYFDFNSGQLQEIISSSIVQIDRWIFMLTLALFIFSWRYIKPVGKPFWVILKAPVFWALLYTAYVAISSFITYG